MGQYYHPCRVGTKEYVYSHTFGSGLKLMEHSWMKNDFVKFVESLIAPGGKWYGSPIVWAGDYADPELDENGEPIRITEENETYEANLYLMGEDKIIPEAPVKGIKLKHYRYLINETDKTFVDKNKVPGGRSAGWEDWRIHPLPLLTCEGNGRGGGDFRGEDFYNVIGSWARKVVTVADKKPKGYTEIVFDLTE